MTPLPTPSDTKGRILLAADALFSERGFVEVSVRDIAERAGVNKALVFYHYETKEALFERVLARYYEAHAAALDAGLEHEGTLAERLHHLLDVYLDFMEENNRYAQLVLREIARDAELTMIQHGLREMYAHVEGILRDTIPADSPLDIRQFFVSFSGLTTTYYLYAPALTGLWQDDPLSTQNLRRRREHLHWVVDRILDGVA